MSQSYQPVVGLEVHAVMETQSKMFCACPVVDSTHEEPNVAVCPVCAGMPGMLPVLNKAAVDYALRVALALNCRVNLTSLFARKSYFYPDLPKGFQISQYEQPLAENGWLMVETTEGEVRVGIRRVHLEEDTGKLSHVQKNGSRYSLVDLNRSGVPLLEIVTEPELHSVEAVRNCAYALRSILRYVGVNSGNLEKGLLRIEPNISIRPAGSETYGTRVEIKNLNSFRSLERAVSYEVARQEELAETGQPVRQETLGWDDLRGKTVAQRSKEFAEDYRYFPEPDLPPLVLEESWVEEIHASLPELPQAKRKRFMSEYALSEYDAELLVAERMVAEFYEEALRAAQQADAKLIANWVAGALFSLLNEGEQGIEALNFDAEQFAGLLDLLASGEINAPAGRQVLAELFAQGGNADAIIAQRGLRQLSDRAALTKLAVEVIAQSPDAVQEYLSGKQGVLNWLFGQAMRAAQGKADPTILRQVLLEELSKRETQQEKSG